jgi:hypothetical protein
MVPPPFDFEGKKLGYTVLARTHETKRMIKAGIRANGFIRSNREGSIGFSRGWQRTAPELAAVTYDSIGRGYRRQYADGRICFSCSRHQGIAQCEPRRAA